MKKVKKGKRQILRKRKTRKIKISSHLCRVAVEVSSTLKGKEMRRLKLDNGLYDSGIFGVGQL